MPSDWTRQQPRASTSALGTLGPKSPAVGKREVPQADFTQPDSVADSLDMCPGSHANGLGSSCPWWICDNHIADVSGIKLIDSSVSLQHLVQHVDLSQYLLNRDEEQAAVRGIGIWLAG